MHVSVADLVHDALGLAAFLLVFGKITKLNSLLTVLALNVQGIVHSFKGDAETTVIGTVAIGALHVSLPDAVAAKGHPATFAFLRLLHYLFAD